MSLTSFIFFMLSSFGLWFNLWAEEDLCTRHLEINPELQLIQQEKEGLTKAQQRLAHYIEKDWLDHIWDNSTHFSNPAVYSFLTNDPQALNVLEALGFKFTPHNYKNPVEFPVNPWVFLHKARNYLANQKKILPAITIQNVYTKEFRFVTKLSDLPKDAANWTNALSGFLDQKVYYKAIHDSILPITVCGSFSDGTPLDLEDHEFQHLLSLYHPDTFPGYMIQMQKMAAFYMQDKVNSLTLFTFAEAFSFVRPDREQKEKFEDFYDRWFDNADSFKELKERSQQLPLQQLELVSRRFLEMYPGLSQYRGGLIRDSILLPGSVLPKNFAANWKLARSNEFPNEEFSLQNWRTLYMYLYVSHNLTFKSPIEPVIGLSQTGWDWNMLKNKIKNHSDISKEDHLNYLRLALTELIWSVKLSYDLGMTAEQLMEAAIHKNHPQHQKALGYFEAVYTVMYSENEKNKSVYYRTFSGR